MHSALEAHAICMAFYLQACSLLDIQSFVTLHIAAWAVLPLVFLMLSLSHCYDHGLAPANPNTLVVAGSHGKWLTPVWESPLFFPLFLLVDCNFCLALWGKYFLGWEMEQVSFFWVSRFFCTAWHSLLLLFFFSFFSFAFSSPSSPSPLPLLFLTWLLSCAILHFSFKGLGLASGKVMCLFLPNPFIWIKTSHNPPALLAFPTCAEWSEKSVTGPKWDLDWICCWMVKPVIPQWSGVPPPSSASSKDSERWLLFFYLFQV